MSKHNRAGVCGAASTSFHGYIRSEVLDATGIEGAHDFTLSFSGITGVSPAQAATGAAAGQPGATDPTGGITLFDALGKQSG